MDKRLELRIIAPSMNLEKMPPTQADMIILRCVNGELGILPGRAPCSIVLGKGKLRIFEGKTETHMQIDGGIASVTGDLVTVLSNSVMWVEN